MERQEGGGGEGSELPAGILRRSTFVAGRLPRDRGWIPRDCAPHTHTHTLPCTCSHKQGTTVHKARQRKVTVIQPAPRSTFHSDGRVAVLGVLGTFHFEFLRNRGEESLRGLPPEPPHPPS